MRRKEIRNIISFKGHLDPVLMLHGFPAEPVTSPGIEKNIDIAQRFNNLGYPVYLIHYEGLGKNRDGIFTFRTSVEDSIQLARTILESHSSLILFGHSWGGFISIILNSVFLNKILKTIALSPLCFLPQRQVLDSLMESLCQEVPYILKDSTTCRDLSQDLISVDRDFLSSKESVIMNLKDFHIFHSKHDLEIPLASSMRMKEMNCNITVVECDTDHGFLENRERQIVKILGALSEKNYSEI